jgi:hypothetical protein
LAWLVPDYCAFNKNHITCIHHSNPNKAQEVKVCFILACIQKTCNHQAHNCWNILTSSKYLCQSSHNVIMSTMKFSIIEDQVQEWKLHLDSGFGNNNSCAGTLFKTRIWTSQWYQTSASHEQTHQVPTILKDIVELKQYYILLQWEKSMGYSWKFCGWVGM